MGAPGGRCDCAAGVANPYSRTTVAVTEIIAFNFAAAPKTSRPRLPAVRTEAPCEATRNPVTPPSHIPFPKQEKGKRGRPSGIVKK